MPDSAGITSSAPGHHALARVRRRDSDSITRAQVVDPTHPSPRLPQELLDNIIDTLRDDPVALSALSIAARCLHFTARRRLFRSPTIVTSHTSFAALVDTLRHAPLHVRYYVENLTFALSDIIGHDFALPADDSAEGVTPLLVASLLQLLPNLASLTLDRVLFPTGDDPGAPGDHAMHGLEQVSLAGMRTLLEDGLRDFHPLSALLGELETFSTEDPPAFALPFLLPATPLPALLPPPPPPLIPIDFDSTHLNTAHLDDTHLDPLPPGWLRGFAQTRPLLSAWSSLRALDVVCRTLADAAHVGAFLRLAGAQLLRLGCAVHGDLFLPASPSTSCSSLPSDTTESTYESIARALALKDSCPALESLALRAAVRDLGAGAGALLGLAAALLGALPPALRCLALELDLGRDGARARACVWDGARGGWGVLRDALARVRVVHLDVCWRCARDGVDGAGTCGGADLVDSVERIMDCGAFSAASRWELY